MQENRGSLRLLRRAPLRPVLCRSPELFFSWSAAAGLVFGIRRAMPATAEKRLDAFASHASIFLGLTFVFYPTLSLMQFKAYVCESYDMGSDGEVRLLKADLAIDCDKSRYKR